MSSPFSLGKNERLKSRKLIEQLFSAGKSFASFPFRVYYILHGQPSPGIASPLQAGFGVSAKNFKKAVDRNRVKRLTREAYRLQKAALAGKLDKNEQQLILFFIYTGKGLPDDKLVKEKLGLILNKLITLSDENNSSNS